MHKPALSGPHRLHSQYIATPMQDAAGVVAAMGAVQAQDYLGSLWAIGLRTKAATEQTITQALAARQIVRTWALRGTIQLVAPSDVRWMLDLVAPRILQRSQKRHRDLGLDAAVLTASEQVLIHALQGGQIVSRPALFGILEAAGIATTGQRGYHILVHFALNKLICFGPHAGKQPTFVLLDEWLPQTPLPVRAEALATLAIRYFTSRGPATLADFVWWAGLTVSEAKQALMAAKSQLKLYRIDQQEYYAADQSLDTIQPQSSVHLLPPFDEFLIAYQDRSASLAAEHVNLVIPGSNGLFNPIIVVDGQVAGTWKRERKPKQTLLSWSPFTTLDAQYLPLLAAAGERYGQFLGTPIQIAYETS